MRSLILKTACIAVIVSSPLIACSQSYYVVVGAFAAKDNASEFKGYLPSQVMDTSYTVSEEESLMHFYILKTSDKESATARALDLKKVVDEWQTEKIARGAMTTEERISGNIV